MYQPVALKSRFDYWLPCWGVELLLDDGETYWVPVDAYTEARAEELARENALEHGLKVVDLVSITLEREGRDDEATRRGI